MAEGRMLKKSISTSKKLAMLKTDAARLLWTWLIPHLDIKGRFSAEAEIVKGYIVPRLTSMTLVLIKEYLADMAEHDLILLYEVKGDMYLELVKFGEFQTLRPSKEAKSRIPGPDKARNTPGVIPDKARTTPDQTGEVGGTTPAQGKLSKEKGSEGKKREVKNKPFFPSHSSKAPDSVKKSQSKAKSSTQADVKAYPKQYNDFWEAYPIEARQEVSKSNVYGSWLAINFDREQGLLELVMLKLKQQVLADKALPFPNEWLDKKMWKANRKEAK